MGLAPKNITSDMTMKLNVPLYLKSTVTQSPWTENFRRRLSQKPFKRLWIAK